MPKPRNERRIAHLYKARRAHTHNVPSRRQPGTYASVLCTKVVCRQPKGEVR